MLTAVQDTYDTSPAFLRLTCFYSPFLHYRLVSSLEIINIGNTGNQNNPDLEVRVVLVTCIPNIEFLLSWKPADDAKNGE